jgi:tetratricopeptide (TPR) repeat protein
VNDVLREVLDKQERARTLRKKGDALRKNQQQQAAEAAYTTGLAELTEAYALLGRAREHFSKSASDSALLDLTLRELVEVSGALGGIYQRLNRQEEALKHYEEGAALEGKLNLPSTYNRLNAVKCALQTGQVSSFDLRERVTQLAELIDQRLRADKSAGDNGWALADLGDCLALLGRIEEARQAYDQFIAKTELKSPQRSLEVLQNLLSQLQAARNPYAHSLQEAVSSLQSKLATG